MPVERTCRYCGKLFTVQFPSDRKRFCNRRCAAFHNRPSQALVIEDQSQMSERTKYRRRSAAGLTQPVFRYPFNEAFFDEWSDDLAWMLGLIWSDGCLFGNSIEICSIDYDLMELVSGLINMTDGVRQKNNRTAWRVVFTSKRIAAWLRSLGLTEAKSLTANFPEIPDVHQGAFVRGLLDGDGSVLESFTRKGQQVPDVRIAWVGASPCLRDGLMRWLSENGINAKVGISHGRVWRVTVHQHAAIRKLHGLLYPSLDATCLVRKRVKYEHWMQTPRAHSGRPKK